MLREEAQSGDRTDRRGHENDGSRARRVHLRVDRRIDGRGDVEALDDRRASPPHRTRRARAIEREHATRRGRRAPRRAQRPWSPGSRRRTRERSPRLAPGSPPAHRTAGRGAPRRPSATTSSEVAFMPRRPRGSWPASSARHTTRSGSHGSRRLYSRGDPSMRDACRPAAAATATGAAESHSY